MRWPRLNSDPGDTRIYLTVPEQCAFARDYVSGRGYDGEANQLIVNLKMGPDAPKTRIHHRTSAINQFASELTLVIPDNATIVPMPPSIPDDGKAVDNRIEEVLLRLQSLPSHRQIRIAKLVEWRSSKQQAHKGGIRDPLELAPLLKWTGENCEATPEVFVCDDVITTGGSYEAVRSVIREHWPGTVVFGVFWARAVGSA
jgi:predicted amidophosphoribosyltransferase